MESVLWKVRNNEKVDFSGTTRDGSSSSHNIEKNIEERTMHRKIKRGPDDGQSKHDKLRN